MQIWIPKDKYVPLFPISSQHRPRRRAAPQGSRIGSSRLDAPLVLGAHGRWAAVGATPYIQDEIELAGLAAEQDRRRPGIKIGTQLQPKSASQQTCQEAVDEI